MISGGSQVGRCQACFRQIHPQCVVVTVGNTNLANISQYERPLVPLLNPIRTQYSCLSPCFYILSLEPAINDLYGNFARANVLKSIYGSVIWLL